MEKLEEVTLKVKAFAAEIDALYGHYLDTTTGFARLVDSLVAARTRLPQKLQGKIDPNTLAFSYGDGAPGQRGTRQLHKTTQGALMARNQKGGSNYTRAGRSLVVLLYTQWEDLHRNRIARALGHDNKDALKSQSFGDLGILRNAIVHRHGVVTEVDARRLKVFICRAGEELLIGPPVVDNLVTQLKKALDDIVTEAGGADPLFRSAVQPWD